MTSATFGVLMSIEPAMAALAGLVLLQERLSLLQVCGITMICVASAGAAVRGSRPAAEMTP